jgi:hypothetical protein
MERKLAISQHVNTLQPGREPLPFSETVGQPEDSWNHGGGYENCEKSRHCPVLTVLDALARVKMPPVTLGDSIAYWAFFCAFGASVYLESGAEAADNIQLNVYIPSFFC